jgi:hypothetical protein
VLLLGLLLAGEMLGAPLPKEVWQRIHAEPGVLRLAVQVLDGLFTDEKLPIGPVNNLRVRERPRDRVHYCLSLLADAAAPNGRSRVKRRINEFRRRSPG